jgi:hypothetical protein
MDLQSMRQKQSWIFFSFLAHGITNFCAHQTKY